jgi:small GTP-binding protein
VRNDDEASGHRNGWTYRPWQNAAHQDTDGIDTDRLKEEKERGITIDLGFAHLTYEDGTEVGVIDVPGHERFVRNMLAGVGGIDLVMLVIAADEGVMPQTREHLSICQLLRVKEGLVALTKADLVDEDWLELVSEDTREFLKGTFLEGKPIVPVSAKTGQGIDELRRIAGTRRSCAPKQLEGNFASPSIVSLRFVALARWSLGHCFLVQFELKIGSRSIPRDRSQNPWLTGA